MSYAVGCYWTHNGTGIPSIGETIELVRDVMRRDEEHIPRKVLRADIPGKRKKERWKTRWKDACQRDLKSTGLRAGDETDRAMWSRKISSLY